MQGKERNTHLPPSAPLGLPGFVQGWDHLHRPIWVFDPVTCRGLYANPAALELWGAASLAELLARDFSQLSPAVRSRIERLGQATADGSSVTERWSFYPQGVPVAVQALISTLPLDDGGRALLFEAAAVDVKGGELRAVEALRHTSNLITLFDADGRRIFANPASFTAYGDPGPGFKDRFQDQEMGAAAFSEVMGGGVLSVLSPVRTLAGDRSHYLDARRVLDPLTGRPCVLLSEQDVTAQVEAERALREAQERAEVAEAKERFLANMSHELRTPLNTVLGFAGLLARSPLTAEQQHHVNRVAEGGASLLKIINDVIRLSEMDSAELELSEAVFSPHAVFAALLEERRGEAAAKGLALALESRVDPDVFLVGDPERLKDVAWHYLDNALKFTETGGVELGLELALIGEAARLEVWVSDTGPGLGGYDPDGLFERFTQGDDSRRKRYGGAGLGLAVSKSLINLMGGAVGVESRAEGGARFWFRVDLPLAPADASREGDTEDAERPLCVLYADDHESNRVLIRALLESQGHQCVTVNDGGEAVEAARAGGFDLILMDIQMPVLDGVSAAAEIRAGAGPATLVPILAVTANTLHDQIDVYRAAGMDDCIGKPLNIPELFAKIRYWGAHGSSSVTAEAQRLAG